MMTIPNTSNHILGGTLLMTEMTGNQKWLREYMYGWMGVGYAWECWSYLMRDKKYSYELPNAFWLELNGNR
jgi:hypothetical protein